MKNTTGNIRETIVKKGLILLLLLSGVMSFAYAQSPEKLVDQGNRLYEEQKFDEAELDYMRALAENAEMTEGIFNLGDATYQQERYEEAIVRFQSIAESAEPDHIRANAWHNLGNAYFQNQDTEKAVEAYKQALRLNGGDLDTKYNLELARQKQQQEQEQQQQDQPQDGDEDQEKNDQDQEQNEDEQDGDGDQQQPDDGEEGDPNEDQKQSKDGEQEGGEEQQPKPGEQQQLSKEEMERILESLDQDEKAVQKKVNQQRVKGQTGKDDKDW